MVGCERAATNWPVAPDGHPYHGVKVTADGHIEWVQGNLGDMSLPTIDYQTYDMDIPQNRGGMRYEE